MFCTQCGCALMLHDKFCGSCGHFLNRRGTLDQQEIVYEECRIEFYIVGERLGIFPRDLGQFQAEVSWEVGHTKAIAGKSEKIHMETCSFDGPKKQNKHHVKALERLVTQLNVAGWELSPSVGKEWYHLVFRRVKVL